jgi:hypothetical protein
MLLCQDFGRGHQRSLISVIDSHQHSADCHNGFSGAHITLYQSIHLKSGLQVFFDIGKRMFLSIS